MHDLVIKEIAVRFFEGMKDINILLDTYLFKLFDEYTKFKVASGQHYYNIQVPSQTLLYWSAFEEFTKRLQREFSILHVIYEVPSEYSRYGNLQGKT